MFKELILRIKVNFSNSLKQDIAINIFKAFWGL